MSDPTPAAAEPDETPALDVPTGPSLATDAMEPASVSAFDRIQTRTSEPSDGSPWRMVGLLVAIGLTAAAAYVLLRPEATPESDLLGRLIESERAFTPAFASVDPKQAEAYVMDQFGWPVAAPDLPGLVLVAVGEADLGGGIFVPAFRYDGPDDESALVFAYDYVLLDRARGDLVLPEAVYGVLAEPEPVDTRRLGDRYLVTWRRRATLYSAVTQDESVFERVGQGVRASE